MSDVAQFSVVLKHLAKYRPDWLVSVRVGRGKHTALTGLCHKVYHDQESHPPESEFESVCSIGFFENYSRYTDKPNSKITNCLAEVFGIDWDAALGRYQVRLGAAAREKAAAYYRAIGAKEGVSRFNVVLVHYAGNTSTWKKNLAHWQAESFCRLAIAAGRIPVILDWDKRSPIYDQKTIFNPGADLECLWGNFGSGDAEVIAALIHLAECYVGVDSGPGKIASATETPTLIVWRDHHPIQFHDPAPNTLHLIPGNWRSLPPCEHEGVARWFQEHYAFRTYEGGEPGLALETRRWLTEILSYKPVESDMEVIPYVMPQGIGDCVWALTKLRSIAAGKPIDVILPGDSHREVENRAVPFLKRFPYIRSVRVLDVQIHADPENKNDAEGRYNYVADGIRNGFHFLMPNGPLERGRRLESWLPEYPCNWHVMDDFDWSGTELGRSLGEALDPFAALYLGPESGHTDEGHNKDWLWEPSHWVELGRQLKNKGLNLCVVGASYDRSFYENYCKKGFEDADLGVVDLIGQMEIGETLALLRRSKVFISYQCGLGIVTHYLGGKVVMWWRPSGNSAHPSRMVSFSEDMRYAWVDPEKADDYVGLVYARENPYDIMAEIERRGWLKT